MKGWPRIVWLGVVVATFMRALSASAQDPTPLTSGLQVNRTLQFSSQDVYRVVLESGAAVIGQLEQKGVNLSVDIYAPNGDKVRTIDTPRVPDGSKNLDFTALQAGTYRFAIHELDDNDKSADYMLTIRVILPPSENAKRLAKEQYPIQALYELWVASLRNPSAVQKFMSERKGKPPVLDYSPVNDSEIRVTYLCLGDVETERVVFYGGPELGVLMRRVGKTDLFVGSQIVAKDARFEYGFALREVHRAGANGEVEYAETKQQGPWLLEMPAAPPQPYVVSQAGVPIGKLETAAIKSALLNEDRKVSVYTPPGYDGKTAANLLIVFDGVTYGGIAEQAEIPTPTILDNLIAEKKIAPTVAILVWTMGKRNRDLMGSSAFADFVSQELIPWTRSHYLIQAGPKSVVAAGSSAGGFAAAFCALLHPESIGKVLSQSGAFWITKNWESVRPPYPRETGLITEEFKRRERLPIQFYLEVGRYDLGAALLGTNRDLRDILQTKGYVVDYREFDGGHDYAVWRGTFADGLISLLGQGPNLRASD